MSTPLEDAVGREFAEVHRRLREAVRGLETETLDFAPAAETNSIAVLVTHLLGSEQGWLSLAADRPFARDRPAEFRASGRSAEELLAAIESAEKAVPNLLRAALASGLAKMRRRGDHDFSVAYCILHALDHTLEHVGQIELTRQLALARG